MQKYRKVKTKKCAARLILVYIYLIILSNNNVQQIWPLEYMQSSKYTITKELLSQITNMKIIFISVSCRHTVEYVEMQNMLQCTCQASNQQSYKVLFNMSSSSLYNTLKSTSESIYHFTYRVRKKSLGQRKSEFTSSLNGYSLCLIVFTYYIKPYISDCVISLLKMIKKLKRLYYLWIGLARAMKLNDNCTFITHTSKLS